jgi:hypothetical protein
MYPYINRRYVETREGNVNEEVRSHRTEQQNTTDYKMKMVKFSSQLFLVTNLSTISCFKHGLL